MEPPLISILIPVKNTAHYLPECINSILQQTYLNWEIIAINDHSTDTSSEVIKEFATKDDRIKIFDNEGNGIIQALQLAFSKSKGTFITRMDSDDIMHQNKLKVLHDSLIKTGKGHLAVGLVQYFSDEGVNDGYVKYEQWLNALTIKGANYLDLYKECVIPSPCWMVYRNDLVACGDFRPNRYPEDYDLAFRFYEKGLQCIPSNQVLHYWRDYSNRTSRTHIHYAQNYFLNIKLHYFVKLHYDKNRPLTVWGAGFKGKTIVKSLLKLNIPFIWVCDNPNKIGKEIYNQMLHDFSFLETLKQPQSIVTVANENAQNEIKAYLLKNKLHPMKDYFFFC